MSFDLALAFKALGEPNRLAIMQRLLRRAIHCRPLDDTASCALDASCCNFSDLVDSLAISKTTVSYHLKELDRAGLIERTPGQARSIRVLLPREHLPDLQ